MVIFILVAATAFAIAFVWWLASGAGRREVA
jgi:hypothetical protein